MNENTLCKPNSWFLWQIDKIMLEDMTPNSEPKEVWMERGAGFPGRLPIRPVDDRPPLTRLRADYDVEDFHNA